MNYNTLLFTFVVYIAIDLTKLATYNLRIGHAFCSIVFIISLYRINAQHLIHENENYACKTQYIVDIHIYIST